MNGYTAFPVTPCSARMACSVTSMHGKDAGRNPDCYREIWEINAVLKEGVLQ